MKNLQMIEHVMLAQIEIVVVPAGEGEEVSKEMKECGLDIRPVDRAIYSLMKMIEDMNWCGLTPAILITELEGSVLVAETMRYLKDFVGAIIIKNELVTDGLKFNTHHVEVLEDFTILYH
jgi:hypothetical protein